MDDLSILICVGVFTILVYLVLFFVLKFLLKDDPGYDNLGGPFALFLIIYMLSFIIPIILLYGKRTLPEIK